MPGSGAVAGRWKIHMFIRSEAANGLVVLLKRSIVERTLAEMPDQDSLRS
jgi:hypothetical protein